MSDDSADIDAKSIGRRRFIKSLFGLGAVAETAQVEAAPARRNVSIFWTNLRNGQIGFPTGTTVPSGQPGSLMKLVTAAALHEAGLFSHDETVECKGIVQIKKRSYRCLYPHGKVGLTKAVGLSCNVFFAEASQKLSTTAILDYASRFGLDKPVAGYGGYSFPKEPKDLTAEYALGLAPDFSVNALQLLRLVSLVGLGGTAPAFHNPGETEHPDAPFVVTLQPSTWMILQQGMRIAEREGTARKLDPHDKLHVAAKTGTAPHGKTFQSWIAGYWPHEQPRYAFCLRSPSGTSQDTAVPEAHKFLFSCEWP